MCERHPSLMQDIDDLVRREFPHLDQGPGLVAEKLEAYRNGRILMECKGAAGRAAALDLLRRRLSGEARKKAG